MSIRHFFEFWAEFDDLHYFSFHFSPPSALHQLHRVRRKRGPEGTTKEKKIGSGKWKGWRRTAKGMFQSKLNAMALYFSATASMKGSIC
jgi:hypothetical protein